MNLPPQLFQSQLGYTKSSVASIVLKGTLCFSIKLFFKHTFELWIFSGPDNIAGMCRLCKWERNVTCQPSWRSVTLPSPFLLLPCTGTFNIITVIWLLFLLCKHIHIQIIVTLQHLFLSFTPSSFCQNPHLYLTAAFLSSSLAYSEPWLCQYLQSSLLALHFHLHLGHLFQNSLTGHEMANVCCFTQIPLVVTGAVYFRLIPLILRVEIS